MTPVQNFVVSARVLFCCVFLAAPVHATTIDEVMPKHERQKNIAPPAESFGFAVGEFHVRPEQLVGYYRQLATQSNRVQVRTIGYSHERRPLLNVIITSPKNHARIAEIEAARARGDADSPLVVYLGYSVHGNEPSGANAAPVVAWHLASSLDAGVTQMLERTVIVIEPMMNPDGIARSASWFNSYRGQTLVADPHTAEHREAWPGGRGNHYWFDLNRDKLFLSHPESRAHVAAYQKWRPHVLGDFHEQGTDAAYFFQPGVATRVHPLTPKKNQQLTAEIAKFHARALDGRGELYFSGERFDDFYYGKGSTYPDIQGSVGILFEQASSRGHVQDSINGPVRFEHTIANQFATSLSTLAGADSLRAQLIAYQTEFFADGKIPAAAGQNHATLMAAPDNPARLREFARVLRAHGIVVHNVQGSHLINGRRYEAGHAIAVPNQQTQSRLFEAMTELRTEFADNSFYDVSAWSMTKAYDLSSAQAGAAVLGEKYFEFNKGGVIGESAIAYVFDWVNDDAAPYAAALLKAGLRLRTLTRPLTLTTTTGVRRFGIGSIVVPVAVQGREARATLATLRSTLAAPFDSVQVFALHTAVGSAGLDLGSPSVRPVELPRAALLIGTGVDATSVGALWHWLDTHLHLPASHLPLERLTTTNLSRYTHIIMGDGNYRLTAEANKALESFVRLGGVIIGVEGALKWADGQSYLHTRQVKAAAKEERAAAEEEKPPVDDKVKPTGADKPKPAAADKPKSDAARKDNSKRMPYRDQDDDFVKNRIAGAIMTVDIDRSHPLAAGLPRNDLPLFLAHADVFRLENDRFGTVAAYADKPLVSGYVSDENKKRLAGSAALTAERVGAGSVIMSAAALGFRGGWPGSRRLLDNALFFGKAFDRARADGDREHSEHAGHGH